MLTTGCDTVRMVKKMKLIPCPNAKHPRCVSFMYVSEFMLSVCM